jgi:hypothetical protein
MQMVKSVETASFGCDRLTEHKGLRKGGLAEKGSFEP